MSHILGWLYESLLGLVFEKVIRSLYQWIIHPFLKGIGILGACRWLGERFCAITSTAVAKLAAGALFGAAFGLAAVLLSRSGREMRSAWERPLLVLFFALVGLTVVAAPLTFSAAHRHIVARKAQGRAAGMWRLAQAVACLMILFLVIGICMGIAMFE